MTYGHGNKPRGEWCRRQELMRWKRWPRSEVEALVKAGTIKTKRLKKVNRQGKKIVGRNYYLVRSAESL